MIFALLVVILSRENAVQARCLYLLSGYVFDSISHLLHTIFWQLNVLLYDSVSPTLQPPSPASHCGGRLYRRTDVCGGLPTLQGPLRRRHLADRLVINSAIS